MNNVNFKLQMNTRARFIFSVLALLVAWCSQNAFGQEPANPAHWKAKLPPELRFSLKDKEWLVPIEFKNVSTTAQQIVRSNGALMYRVKGSVIAPDGTPSDAVKARTFSAFPMNSKFAHAESGKSINVECDIRQWLLIDKLGAYEVCIDRLLSLGDANDNAVGLPVEKVIPVGKIKIQVTP